MTNDLTLMSCPYDDDFCAQPATFTTEHVDDLGVSGLLVCAAGHRWQVTRLGST